MCARDSARVSGRVTVTFIKIHLYLFPDRAYIVQMGEGYRVNILSKSLRPRNARISIYSNILREKQRKYSINRYH
jgi:hypothetical protein